MESGKRHADSLKGTDSDFNSKRFETLEDDARNVFKALKAQNFQMTVSQIND